MTVDDTHPALRDYDLDDDYIDTEKQTADLKVTDQEAATDDGNPIDTAKQTNSVDYSHLYNRDDDAMSGTAIDVKIDKYDVQDRDGRGGTWTGFDGTEGGGFYGRQVYRDGRKRTYAQWLRLLQDGYRSNQRKQDNYDADKQRWIDTFCAELDVNPHQKRRVEHIIDDINMKYMAFYNTELVILAVTSLVVNLDDRWMRDEDAFKQLVKATDSSMDDVKNARLLVKEKTDRL